jgi:hypothetical protein
MSVHLAEIDAGQAKRSKSIQSLHSSPEQTDLQESNTEQEGAQPLRGSGRVKKRELWLQKLRPFKIPTIFVRRMEV